MTQYCNYETFLVDNQNLKDFEEVDGITTPGWYWWSCQPGCLPDGDAFGPYEKEADIITYPFDDELAEKILKETEQ